MDLFVAALGGAALVALSAPAWVLVVERLSAEYAGDCVSLALFAFVLVLAVGWAGRGRYAAFLGVRHLFSYPPCWLAGAFGSVVLFLFWAFVPGAAPVCVASEALTAAFWIALVIGVVCFAVDVGARAAGRLRLEAPGGSRTDPAVDVNLENFRGWIKDDAPISHPALDRFQLDRIAQRVADRLHSESADPPTMVVTGALGVGKTSLLRLVSHHLQRERTSTEIVALSLWKYESSQAAASAILNALVARLSEHINGVGMTGIPAQYVAAIDEAWKAGAQLVRTVNSSPSPEDVLERLGDAAERIGVKLVLWVEDLERFADSAEKRGPVLALLHQLDGLSSITVILSTTSLETWFDIEKLARYVERIPDLQAVQVFRLLHGFRSQCLAKPFLDAAFPKQRTELDFREVEQSWMGSILGALSSGRSVASALAVVCRTPRQLKQALRHCDYVWDNLRGEVDFDDVLVMSVIRHTAPGVYALVDTHSAALRDGEPQLPNDRGKPTPFRKRLGETLNGHLHAEALEVLINFVFPTGDASEAVRPQGFRSRARDYWARFQTVPALTSDERDQSIIGECLQFDAGGCEKLAERFARGGQEAALEVFTPRMGSVDQIRILRAWIDAQASQARCANDADGHPHGLISIWRGHLHTKRSDVLDQSELKDVLLDAIGKCLPLHLFLCKELVQWFTNTDESEYALLARESSAEVQAELHREMLRHFSDGSDNLHAASALVEAVKHATPYTLVHACWGIARIRQGKQWEGIPFDGWPAFRDTVLKAANVDARALFPQIVPFVTRHDHEFLHGVSQPTARFVNAAAETLFGTQTLLELFSSVELAPFEDSAIQLGHLCIREAAKNGAVRDGAPFVSPMLHKHPRVASGV